MLHCLHRQVHELGQTKGAAAAAAAAAAANAAPVAAAPAAGALSLTPIAAEGLSVDDDGNRAKRTIKIKVLCVIADARRSTCIVTGWLSIREHAGASLR